MAQIGRFAALDGKIVPFEETNISIASSAVLYGLSVYTVFFAKKTDDGLLGFRLPQHLERLRQSARLIGMDDVAHLTVEKDFIATMRELAKANQSPVNQCFRVTIHANQLVPGVRTRDMKLSLSVFSYDAKPILPQTGAKLKTSLWRRVADNAIPARAKVNGAYVNSCLAKQEAIDSGCHDCIFLNQFGYVSELTAANIFLIKDSVLITPDPASDILEGITRRSVIELAREAGLTVVERKVALTELYTADEVFATGSSTFIAPVTEIDGRIVSAGKPGPITAQLREKLKEAQNNPGNYTTLL
jgi:branched-chain amino acid aminotransferase